MNKYYNSYVYPNLLLVSAGGVAFAGLWNFLLVHRPVELRSSGVAMWWTVLCAVAVINACGWHRTAQRVARQSAMADGPVALFRKRQLWLSAVFVLGCGFRSLIPRADVQRFGLIDSWLSSVLIGRSVATAAELCFVAQWALLLYAAARGVGSRFGVAVAWLLVPLVVVAEVCSWSAILTTCYLGNVAEESLWRSLRRCSLPPASSSGRVAGTCAGRSWPRRWPLASFILCLWYPWIFPCISLAGGPTRPAEGRTCARPGAERRLGARVVTFSWEQWRAEIPWMTLYFSVCVWWSLALVHAPRPEPDPVPDRPAPAEPRFAPRSSSLCLSAAPENRI